MEINFEKEQYINEKTEVGGRIVIHNPYLIPFIQEDSFFLLPGKHYEIFLSKESTKLLPPPFPTKCQKYPDIYSGTGGPMSKKECIVLCSEKRFTQRCKCWPQDVPYRWTDMQDDTERDFCASRQEYKSDFDRRVGCGIAGTAQECLDPKVCPDDCLYVKKGLFEGASNPFFIDKTTHCCHTDVCILSLT